MNTETLQRHYAAIGARLEIEGPPFRGFSLDVRTNGREEHFALTFGGAPRELDVVDVDKRGRHLLLLVRRGEVKSKFLCGYDERHWFVAAVPEDARGVTGVATAKAALQPPVVQEAVARLRPKDPFRRRGAGYVRQGEWFFVPEPSIAPPEAHVLRDERLTRGRGSPHVIERAVRAGGTIVYVSPAFPRIFSETAFNRLPAWQRRGYDWDQLRRDPELYASGTVRHPDHATVRLDGWHRVAMNTEQRARAKQHVAFLD